MYCAVSVTKGTGLNSFTIRVSPTKQRFQRNGQKGMNQKRMKNWQMKTSKLLETKLNGDQTITNNKDMRASEIASKASIKLTLSFTRNEKSKQDTMKRRYISDNIVLWNITWTPLQSLPRWQVEPPSVHPFERTTLDNN